MRSEYLIAPFFAATALLTVGAPAVDAREGDRAYCLELTHRAVRANAQAGKWLDRVRRHDGVVVQCDDKRIEFRRFVTAAPDRMGDDWEEREEKAWNVTQCAISARERRSRKAGRCAPCTRPRPAETYRSTPSVTDAKGELYAR
jgi:hypothetical protein